MIRSHSLLFSDFSTDWYKKWAKVLKQDKNHLEGHALKANKFWQNAIMTQVLFERGFLAPGKTGIGFGVGQERLPALFADAGVQILATDQDFRTEKAKHWQKYELAHDAYSLNKLGISNKERFRKNVSFQPVDMTKIPKKLYGKYDFLWSNCALGHLGSIDAGLEFIVNSAKCLKKGGVATHTTEMNVLSNKATVDSGDTVIFRPKDIYRLSQMLAEIGCELEPLRFSPGSSKEDERITMHPEFGNGFSKIHFKGHLITQVVLIVRKVESISRTYRLKHHHAYYRNVLTQAKYSKTTKFYDYMRSLENSRVPDQSIIPLKKEVNIHLENKPRYIYLEFHNKSNIKLTGVEKKQDTSWPIVLATSEPTDRLSQFLANDWYGGQANRPSCSLFIKDKSNTWKKVDSIKPGQKFAYRVKLDPKNCKKGSYSESFHIVQEGNRHIEDSRVNVSITVA